MKFIDTEIEGVYIIELTSIGDERGFFARTYCEKEFNARGLKTPGVQANMSYSAMPGTLRGLHYQIAPSAETKLVRCTRGAIVDVAVDMRDGSATKGQHVAVELTQENRLSLYVPENFAHGYQTLEPDTEVVYQVTGFYDPECERGLRYNDPALNIQWPLKVSTLSEKDSAWELLEPR